MCQKYGDGFDFLYIWYSTINLKNKKLWQELETYSMADRESWVI
jgi:hypothetical protein